MSKRILIVGADWCARSSLAAALAPRGYQVVMAGSGGKSQELVTAVRECVPTPVLAEVERDPRPYGKKARRALRGGRHD